ncbi:MAG: hypothetical protein PHI05_00565 [Bacilli bacterium]|nr:hypothetical protein [Bacilli bacterium]
MEFIKKHKLKIILVVVFLILIIFAYIGVKELLYPDTRKDLYGSRLDGMEQFNVDDNRLKEEVKELSKDEKIEKIDSHLSGRTINYTIHIKGDLDLITSKSFGDKILEKFSDEEKQYFDFQLFIVNDVENSEHYPIVGYKHKTSLTFVWTN